MSKNTNDPTAEQVLALAVVQEAAERLVAMAERLDCVVEVKLVPKPHAPEQFNTFIVVQLKQHRS